jgi:hypothetical protein
MNKKPEEEIDDWNLIEIGDQVKHHKWGVGTVLFRSGTGDHAKAIVVFPEEGQKKMMLRYAKLKKVGTTSLKGIEKLKQLPKAPPKEPVRPVEEAEPAVDLHGAKEEEDLILGEEEPEVVGFDDEEEDAIEPPGEDEEKS